MARGCVTPAGAAEAPEPTPSLPAVVGQRLRGRIPALDKDGVEFEVYFINPAGDYATWRATRQSSGYDVRSFEVRVRPVAKVADFRPGMSVLFDGSPQ